MNRQYHHELVIENLPKCIMYEGKLPIRLSITNIKMPTVEVGFGFYYKRQPCEITVCDRRDEWTDAIKKWYRYVFDPCSTKLYAINNHKVDGKVYEYDSDGNVTTSFDVHGMFPIMLDEEESYKDIFTVTVTFSVDSVGSLEKAKDYKTENLFVQNVPTLSDAIENGPLSWDEYFMNVAILASLRSKDVTKVGSVLVLNKKLVGMGYNGFPSGVDESKLPTSRVGSFSDVKYAYTIHSEQNCILNSPVYDITGATLYVTLFPCNECVKLIIQKGISEIVYLSDKHHDDPPYVASRRLLALTNIVVRQYNSRIIVNV